MKINHVATLDAIQQFVASDLKGDKERTLLIITKEKGVMSLSCINESKMSPQKLLWERIKALFRKSNLNLLRVLSFIGETTKNHEEFKEPVAQLCKLLERKISNHKYTIESKRKAQLARIAKLQVNPAAEVKNENISPTPANTPVILDETYIKAKAFMLALLAKEVPDYEKRFNSKAIEYLIQSRIRQIPGKEHAYSRERLESYNFLITWLDSNGYEAGFAEDDGYCFYHACAQGLSKELGREITYPTICKEIDIFAEEQRDKPLWKSKKAVRSLKEIVETEKVDYKTYEEWKERIGKVDVTTPPIWGRPAIEGVIIAEKYRVKIKTVEVQVNPEAVLPKALAKIIDKDRFQRFLKREDSAEEKKELFYVHEAVKRIIRLKASTLESTDSWEKHFLDALESEREPHKALQMSLPDELKVHLSPKALNKKIASLKEEYDFALVIDGAVEDLGKGVEYGSLYAIPEWSSTSPFEAEKKELPEIFMANPGGHFIPVFKKK